MTLGVCYAEKTRLHARFFLRMTSICRAQRQMPLRSIVPLYQIVPRALWRRSRVQSLLKLIFVRTCIECPIESTIWDDLFIDSTI